MATVVSQKLSGATGQEKYFYEGKIESAKFFIDRTTSLVPEKCDILKNNDTGAMRISEEAFGI
jgi:hypothetical protein